VHRPERWPRSAKSSRRKANEYAPGNAARHRDVVGHCTGTGIAAASGRPRYARSVGEHEELSMAAHILIEGLRRLGLHGTELAKAQASTLRVHLFKIGALVSTSVRRVYIRLSSAYPRQELFRAIIRRLRPEAPATI
jgi:hypothetical protein